MENKKKYLIGGLFYFLAFISFISFLRSINYSRNMNSLFFFLIQLKLLTFILHIIFLLSMFALMIDRTLSRICISVPPKAQVCTLLVFNSVAVILLAAISPVNTCCFAVWRSYNSFFGDKYSKY